MEELEVYRSRLQSAFEGHNVDEVIKILKELKAMNVEIPFTVECVPGTGKLSDES